MIDNKQYTVNINSCGSSLEARKADAVLRSQPVDGGELVFIDAVSPSGFDGKNSVVIYTGISGKAEFTAIVNHSPFWCRPVFGEDLKDVPDMTQGLLIKESENKYSYIVPLVGESFKSVLRGTPAGLTVRVFSNMPGMTRVEDHPAFVRVSGNDPDGLTRRAAEIISTALPSCKLRSEKKLPKVFSRLGWCSWDALHIFINKKELLEKAAEFKEKNIPVGFAILDDMWADCTLIDVFPRELECDKTMIPTMHKAKMRDFDVDPRRFPEGMADTVASLKAAGIPDIGIWFPTTGYWSGLEPDGPLASKFGDDLIEAAGGRLIIKPEKESAARWFDYLCEKVSEWGGDFVKIDNQGCHRFYSGLYPVAESAGAINGAIDAAAFKYFDGALINCMGMPNECMFSRPASAVCRCSDDFQPESPDWFTKNILQCSFNGLLQGRFYINDWDMWWTDDAQAVKNSICRVISGGPVYLSDKTGRTVAEVLSPVCLSDGKLLICDESATPVPGCLFGDPSISGKPFMIRNKLGGCGLVAAFDLDKGNRPVSGCLSPSDALLPEGDYICREFFTGNTVRLAPGESVDVVLQGNSSYALYTFYPVNGRDIVPLGRIDLYTGPGAVMSDDGEVLELIEGGPTGFYSEHPVIITADGVPVETKRCGNVTVAKLPADKNILKYGK